MALAVLVTITYSDVYLKNTSDKEVCYKVYNIIDSELLKGNNTIKIDLSTCYIRNLFDPYKSS